MLEEGGGNGDGGDVAEEVAEMVEGMGEEAEELLEIIMMDPEHEYILYILKVLAMIHTSVSIAMLIGYYVLKVSPLIFNFEVEFFEKFYTFIGEFLTGNIFSVDLFCLFFGSKNVSFLARKFFNWHLYCSFLVCVFSFWNLLFLIGTYSIFRLLYIFFGSKLI